MTGSAVYDAIIIGAGPAGSAAAILLARRGWRIVLIERAPWPRDKPCGGCVNAGACASLRALGITGLSAAPIDRFHLALGPRSIEIALPPGLAMQRRQLDAALVARAESCGVEFRPHAAARLLIDTGDLPRVALGATTLAARLILIADGLQGSFLADQPWARWSIARNSLFGVSATFRVHHAALHPHQAIHMHVSSGGYVGLVQLDPETVHLGAAVDRAAARAAGGLAQLIARILRHCRQPLAERLTELRLQGTTSLTRRRMMLGRHRMLILGDAAGYVEPFTGQGIAWALESASQLVALLPERLDSWPAGLAEQWTRHHAGTLVRRQRLCRLLRPLLRHPVLASPTFLLAGLLPSLARHVAQSITASPRVQMSNAAAP